MHSLVQHKTNFWIYMARVLKGLLNSLPMVNGNAYNAEIFFIQTMETKRFFTFEITMYVLVSSFRLILILILWVYGHYNYFTVRGSTLYLRIWRVYKDGLCAERLIVRESWAIFKQNLKQFPYQKIILPLHSIGSLTISLHSTVIEGFFTEQNVRWSKLIMKKIETRHILSWHANLPDILSAVGRQLR